MSKKLLIQTLNEILLLIADEQELFDLIQNELKISDVDLDTILNAEITDVEHNELG